MRSLDWIALGVFGLTALLGTRLEAGERAPDLALVGVDGGEVRYAAPARSHGAVPEEAEKKAKTATLVLFVRPNQRQSGAALRDLRAWREGSPALAQRVRSIAIASGKVEGPDLESFRSLLVESASITGALDPQKKAFEAFGVIALPTTFVIDRSGTITKVLPGRSAGFPVQLNTALHGALGIELPTAPDETPEDPAAAAADRHGRLARNLIARRRYDDAAKELAKAVELQPQDVDLRVALGEVQLRLEDGEAARATFEEAMRLGPENRRARIGAAKALALGDDLEAAEKALRAELLRPPLDSDLYYHLGNVLQRQGRHEDAAAAFREAYERLLEGR